ncbi:MAG: hypothetical protein M1834_003587 [Cirrosporium novae-zelandiae]|nr:MAG: hypothetical protein M1834_003587 [Cirrosporium novae-zelandiae]
MSSLSQNLTQKQVESNGKCHLTFLRLPFEIRLMIYRHAFFSSPDSTNRRVIRNKTNPVVKSTTFSSLSRVCRTIYIEAMTLFYSEAFFSFRDPGDLYFFLNCIGPHFRALLRRVGVKFKDGFTEIYARDIYRNPTLMRDTFLLLAEAKGLQELEIMIDPRSTLFSAEFIDIDWIDELPELNPVKDVLGAKKIKWHANYDDNEDDLNHLVDLALKLQEEMGIGID